MSKKILLNLPQSFHQATFLEPCRDRLRALGELRQTSHNTPEEIAADLAWADAVMMWGWPTLDSALLAASVPIEFLGHIDMSRNMARMETGAGIPVSLSKACWSPAVAEMALTLILAALRRTSNHHRAMWDGSEKWCDTLALATDIDPAERELTGLSVGIVGLGQVGRRLASFLMPFDVDLHIVDPFVPDAVIGRFHGRRVDIDAMIAACDVVVLCAAANEGTARLFHVGRIDALRPDAVFVNVARAMLVDNAALAARLARGDLFAALDVFETEPLVADDTLRRLPNAYLTPHRAGGLRSSILRALDFLIDDYAALRSGNPRRHALDPAHIDALDDF